jgi:DNA polymerase-3 subunit epsilon
MADLQTPRNRPEAIRWAQEMVKEGAVFLDFETTDIKDAEVVQVGVLDINGQPIIETLVKPATSINPRAMAVHGITHEMVMDAPSFEEIYVQLSVSLAGRYVIAYNAPFDRGVLAGSCERRGLPLPKIKSWACAMRAYAVYHGHAGKNGYQWQSLSKACMQQKIIVDKAHDAMGDCMMTLALVKRMAEASEK